MSNLKLLQSKIPINSLSQSNVEVLQKDVVVEHKKKGATIFKTGDSDDNFIYLLKGQIQLIPSDGGSNRIIDAKDDEANYALAQLKPRQFTAKAVADVAVAIVNGSKMERLLSIDQMSDDWLSTDGYEVTEFGQDVDAELLVSMLNKETFKQLPVERINELFSRLEPATVKVGEVVITQGKPGDYYYIVKHGKFNVSRKTTDRKVEILATLTDGDVFGEEALISNKPRNASVISMADGELVRLSRRDFDKLLKPNLVPSLDQAETEKLLKAGAGLLDVRTADEFKQGALNIATNVPLSQLRRAIEKLDKDKKYILCCQTGARSAVAAFLLNQRGFEVYILKGGLQSLNKAPKVGP